MSQKTERYHRYLLAKAVESAVFEAGMLAYSLRESDPERSAHWMRHADRLESKYSNEHKEHYSVTIQRHEHPLLEG